jgi:hypothetical protein
MEIRGNVLSVSGNVAEVCIINRERKACENCSACPQETGTQDSIRVAAVPGIRTGQEVILQSNKNWFIRNKILLIVIAFVLGMVITEAIGKLVSFGTYSRNITMAGGITASVIVSCIVWIKRPQYLFKIKLVP